MAAERQPVTHLIPRSWPPENLKIVAASGCVLRTADGSELLDAASGALAATLGYGIPEVTKAVVEQARKLPFAHSGHFATEAAERYASELAAVLPGEGPDHLGRMMFATGGTEAIELAVTLAYRVHVAHGEPDRRVLLTRHLSYHGASLNAMALGARTSLRSLVAPLLQAYPHLPPPYPYRPEWHARFPGSVANVPGLESALPRELTEAEQERGARDPVSALEVAIEVIGPERVCAFIAEPIIGASGGAVVPPDDYWPRVRDICDRHGVLWIADEVMTGMGRTGTWLASEHWGALPDIIALGKGMSSGAVPLSAVVVRERHGEAIVHAAPGFPLGFTFANHPLGAAAGRAVLRYVREHELLARAHQIGRRLRDGLQEALGDHPCVGEIRGRGAMIGIELVADRDSRRPFAREDDITGAVLRIARETAGVLFYPVRGCADGVRGDGFLVAPPLIATESHIDRIIETASLAVRGLVTCCEKSPRFFKGELTMTQKEPRIVQLEAGTHYICQCGQSKNPPLCDGSHKGSDKQPFPLEITEAKQVSLCGCLESGNLPFCDGTHVQSE